MKYKTCPFCHAHLDFGERCNCQEEEKTAELKRQKAIFIEPDSNKFSFNFERCN